MHTQQYFVNSALSVGEAALLVHSSTLLTTHGAALHVGFASSALSLGGASPYVHAVVLHHIHIFLWKEYLSRQRRPTCIYLRFCEKQPHIIPAGSISGWMGLMYACYGALLFLLDLAPEGMA